MDLKKVFIRRVDLSIVSEETEADLEGMVTLLRCYARDPMGGGKDLPPYTLSHLANELRRRASISLVLLACYGTDNERIGICNCFESFSTFACQPILNIHDVFILPDYRGIGVAQLLLRHVEEEAIRRGCCKLTLEVLSKNESAKIAYTKYGFSNYSLSESTGIAEFWEKCL